MRFSLLAPVLCGALSASATTYYVSPTGSDSNNGTSQSTPWRTLDKLTQVQYTVVAGDQILFQRGGVYRGTLNIAGYGTAAAPIVIGAYGAGAAPVISGGTQVTGWTQHSGNIYKASLGTGVDVKYLFSNGQAMTLARYPNTGWLRNDHGTPTSLQDAALTQSSGYWTGATLVVRASNWNYDLATVSGFSGNTLTFPTIYDQLWDYDWGYFLCNKLSELDQAGEWFFDKTTGILYFWAPNNVSPATLNIEAATKARGAYVYWHRPYITIQDLAFQYQTEAGVFVEDADHITVNNCTFTDMYTGIKTVGSNNTYSNSTFTRTYATALHVLDNNTVISGNTLTDIAMVPGLGETSWGYFGIRCTGTGMTIRGNRLQNIGYIGIVAEYNALVEKNVVDNAVAILNDGGGIAFDYSDGMVIQDNIVRNCVGNLESSAPDFNSYHKICHGLYFGNHGIRNTTMQRNTSYNNKGSGIHVDHSMNAANNIIRDNTCFNNEVQLSLSDYSNYSGPAAVAPYYVASYSETYSGNVFYSIAPDQLCMKQYNCYSASPVDFGTFTNNKYFNPYNEMSIFVMNTFSGSQKYFALERWQTDKAEDAGSTRSPLRQSLVSTTAELSGNLVVNGTFDTNVNGWTGWPTNAQVTRVTTNLDNGALKAYLPNNSVYNEFSMRNPDLFSVQSGQWYRMRFSLQSNACGDLKAGLKGQSQLTGASTIYQRQIPFDTQRRDIEMYFQSNLSDNALVQFVNQYTEPMYYLDNVQIHKVQVQPVDPAQMHVLLVNDQTTTQSYALPAGCWSDLSGTVVSGSVSLQPYTSKVIYKVDGTGGCGQQQVTNGSVTVKVNLGGAMNWSAGLMRDDLRAAGLVPATEPYTARGFALENAGATVPAALLQATGNQAIVDWVLIELKNNDAGYTVAGRRAALVRRDGSVVMPDGNTVVTFNVTTQGKYLVVRHRNHLGVMTAAPLTANGITVDFTSGTGTYGQTAQQSNGTRFGLWPGNVNGDATVKYTGSVNDRDPVLSAIGGSIPTAAVTGYRNEDVNMDAWTLYTGAGNDRDFILVTVGGSLPTATRAEQVP
ncbi:MAG: right-handed parallel beta-helix repeat-containing protein [Bacteroidetes bacterium]|nr:right-handed parallel beta-helix repeat-containing protein [Bacteroidota bacterium]